MKEHGVGVGWGGGCRTSTNAGVTKCWEKPIVAGTEWMRGMAPEQWVSEVDPLKTLSFYSECRAKH